MALSFRTNACEASAEAETPQASRGLTWLGERGEATAKTCEGAKDRRGRRKRNARATLDMSCCGANVSAGVGTRELACGTASLSSDLPRKV